MEKETYCVFHMVRELVAQASSDERFGMGCYYGITNLTGSGLHCLKGFLTRLTEVGGPKLRVWYHSMGP